LEELVGKISDEPDTDRTGKTISRSDAITPGRIHMIFLLITPQSVARIQPRFLADIVGLVDSEYVTDRLKQASEPEEVIEAIRDGMQVVLD
jgi:mannitol/fructose-specific phosphotransferase system IIA component (Ntr-type)